jgi:resuscitation-promoting factor RpfB
MGEAPAGPARFLRTHQTLVLLVVLVAVVVVALSVTGFAWAKKGVTVVVDGDTRYIKTGAETVGTLLAQADITVGASDVVTPSQASTVDDGMSVVVRHAIPVTVVIAGESMQIDVIGTTVADALVAAGLDPGRGITVTPPLDAPLHPGMVIETTDVFMRAIEEEYPVPFEVVTENDPKLPQGSRSIKQRGKDGIGVRIYRVLVSGGVEGARSLIEDRVISGPTPEIVAVGTKRSSGQIPARTRAASAQPPADGERLAVTATGYSSADPGVGSRTATGARAAYGIIAVDPSIIPLGTKVYVPGYGNAIAADTGGAIRGNKIDLCFDSRAEALAWGRRSVTITILP